MGVTKGTKTLVYNRPRPRERPFFLSFFLATGEKSDQCFCDQSFEVKIQRKNGFLFVADLGSLSNPVSLSFCPSFSVSFLYLFLSPPLTFSSYVPLHLSPFVSFPPHVSLSFSLLSSSSCLSFYLFSSSCISLCISFLGNRDNFFCKNRTLTSRNLGLQKGGEMHSGPLNFQQRRRLEKI